MDRLYLHYYILYIVYALLHVCDCAGAILQIVSVEYKTSGGRARPRETAKRLPGRGKKGEKRTKVDK